MCATLHSTRRLAPAALQGLRTGEPRAFSAGARLEETAGHDEENAQQRAPEDSMDLLEYGGRAVRDAAPLWDPKCTTHEHNTHRETGSRTRRANPWLPAGEGSGGRRQSGADAESLSPI